MEIAAGMVYLHSRTPTLLHGDLKAINCLVDKNGTVKITDFGFARIKSESARTSMQKDKGGGTRRWMSPERLKGG